MEPSSSKPVSRTRGYLRYLRIAFSAVCGILCLLLIVLWVRSYYTADGLQVCFWDRQSVLLASKQGRLAAAVFKATTSSEQSRAKIISYPVGDERSFPFGPVDQYESALGFGWIDRPIRLDTRLPRRRPGDDRVSRGAAMRATAAARLDGSALMVPYWLVVLAVCTISVVATPHWFSFTSRERLASVLGYHLTARFSLRTLLIAMTLVALAFGVAVMMLRGS